MVGAEPVSAMLGDPCQVDGDDCGGDAPYCAAQPGQAEGYCTPTGCLETPALCPEGWRCLDLSIFQPDAPSICLAE